MTINHFGFDVVCAAPRGTLNGPNPCPYQLGPEKRDVPQPCVLRGRSKYARVSINFQLIENFIYCQQKVKNESEKKKENENERE